MIMAHESFKWYVLILVPYLNLTAAIYSHIILTFSYDTSYIYIYIWNGWNVCTSRKCTIAYI
jgi:hypothetical protein